MGREIKRVPVGFDWPLREVWEGFLMPDKFGETPCEACCYDRAPTILDEMFPSPRSGTGYSPRANHLHDQWYGYVPFDPESTGSARLTAESPAVRAFAERNVGDSPEFYGTGEWAVVREAQRLADLWNGQWGHHLAQEDVDALVAGGRLMDFTHKWSNGWQKIEPAVTPTAAQVNEWSLGGMGHDSINAGVVISARCEREGVSDMCPACKGHGSNEAYEGQRAESEAWEPSEPPMGEGWQLWETVSEGSPISPAFATAGELAAWMSEPERGRDWMPAENAAKFIAAGWAPTLIGSPQTGVVSGAEWVGSQPDAETTP